MGNWKITILFKFKNFINVILTIQLTKSTNEGEERIQKDAEYVFGGKVKGKKKVKLTVI
jgi:hypothetical protein